MAAPAGFMNVLNRKYDIQQQEASARSALFNMQANLMPSQTASENALRAAQGYATREQGATYGPLAGASIAGTMAGIPEMGARAGYYGAMGRVAGLGAEPYGYGAASEIVRQLRMGQPGGGSSGAPSTAPTTPSGPLTITPPAGGQSNVVDGTPLTPTSPWSMHFEEVPTRSPDRPYEFARGASKVPGKAKGGAPSSAGLMGALPSLMAMMGGGGGGVPSSQGAPFAMGGAVPGRGSGKVDTVPAMLAPGEAVLNKPAAEMMGRDKIAKANAAGRTKMGGMPKPMAGGHAGGTDSVMKRMIDNMNTQPADPALLRALALAPQLPRPAPAPIPVPKSQSFAGGTEEITGKPAPGQTQTNGSWGGQNQGLRLQLGMGAPKPAPAPTPVPKPQSFAGGIGFVEASRVGGGGFGEAPRVGGGGFGEAPRVAASVSAPAPASPRMTSMKAPEDRGAMYAGGTSNVGDPSPTQQGGLPSPPWTVGGIDHATPDSGYGDQRIDPGHRNLGQSPTPRPGLSYGDSSKPYAGAHPMPSNRPDYYKGYAKGASEVHATLKMFGKGLAKPKPIATGRGMV